MSVEDVLGLVLGPIAVVCMVLSLHALVKINIALKQCWKEGREAEAMTDEQFLNYVTLHSRTERALFSYDQVKRLYKLAFVREEPPIEPGQWVRISEIKADVLVRRARRYSKLSVLDGGKKATG